MPRFAPPIRWLLPMAMLATACQSSRAVKQDGPVAPGASGVAPSSRPVYRHSVLPGGAQSGAEVKQKLAQDAPAAAHYRSINPDKLKAVHLKQDRRAYVSYRVGQKIYWTRKPQLLKAGELVLTDGEQTVRARCGNRLEDEPQEEVQTADESPSDEEFEQIAEPDGHWPATGVPNDRAGRQLTAIMEPLFGWDPGGAALPGAGGPAGQPSTPGTTPNPEARALTPGPLGSGGGGIGFPGGGFGPEPSGPPPEGESPFEPPVNPGPGPLPGPPRTPIVPPVVIPPGGGDPEPPELPEPKPDPESPGPKPPPVPPVYGPPVPPPPTSPPRDTPPRTPPNPGGPTPKGPPPTSGPPDDEPSPKPPRVPPTPSPERPRGPTDFPDPPDSPPEIPEPGTALLLMGGFGALLWSAYRTRRKR